MSEMIVGLRKVIYLHIWWIRWYSDLQYLWMDEMRSNGKKRMRMSEGERCYLAECQREREGLIHHGFQSNNAQKHFS